MHTRNNASCVIALGYMDDYSEKTIQGVRWDDSMRRMMTDGFDTFYEMGPGRVLTGLMKRIDRKVLCTNVPAR